MSGAEARLTYTRDSCCILVKSRVQLVGYSVTGRPWTGHYLLKIGPASVLYPTSCIPQYGETNMTKKFTSSELVAAITAWGKAGSEWIKQGQELAMASLQHLEDHGDTGYLNRLYLAMPKGTKSSAMIQWILAFSRLEANTGEDKSEKPFIAVKGNGKVNKLEEAAKKPWYDFKPEPKPDEVFDFQAAMLALIKKAKGKTHIAHADLLAQCEALVSNDTTADTPDPLSST